MPARVSTSKMSNQEKLDFVVDAIANGGQSMLYGASLIDLIDDIPRRVVKSKVVRDGRKIDLDQEIADSKTLGLRTEAQLAGLTAAVQALAAGSGADPEFIKQTIDAAIDRNLAKITATVTIEAAPNLKQEG
ncbi:hypothetical protein RI444_15495 [Paenarthrobacter sp. AT5]|uniref:hypothetical protein n=1 Tax=Paenarthrobacter TaxID=1742992 RepID=UPI001A993E3F|nr:MULTISPECIES: hypothetical protein [Paenarthrobacter]WOC59912.1 hypothetical protein RI444_15495 [Paenarthrobacter sp. AT5]